MRFSSLFLIAAVLLGAVATARAQSALVLGVEASLADLDPARRSPHAPTLASLLHAPLLRLDHTTAEMDKTASMLASFTVQAGQEWILDLKADLKFSDGTPIDAAAVVANIKRILATREPGLLTPHLEGLLYNIAVVSPTRIKMTLSRPHMSLLYVLSSPRAGIVSPKSLQEGFQGTALAGSGPYRLVKRGVDSLELEANPNYVVGPPRIPKVTVKKAPAGPSRLMWLLAGQGHLVEGLLEQDAKRAFELAECASLEAPGLGGVGVYIDTTRPPFDATWMCDAFFQAFDSSAIAPWLYDRRVSTARRALPASAWANPPGSSIPAHAPEAAKSAVESGVTVGRPRSFILGVAVDGAAVAPSDLEPMLARLRWGFLQAGFTVLTEPITGDPTPVFTRPMPPQAVLFSYGATADDPGLLIGEMVAKQKGAIFERLELGAEPGTLLEKVGTAVQLEAHRFLYESIGTQIGDTKRLAFVAHPVRRVTFVTGLQGVRLGADGAVELDAAELIER